MSSDDISSLKSQISALDQPEKSENLIDFRPDSKELTSKGLTYVIFLSIFGLCFLVGFGLIIYSYIQSNNDVNMIHKYEKLLENRTFELVCWKAADPKNPCNTAADPEVKLFNWQEQNYFNTLSKNYACLEIQNRINLKTPTPLDLSMTDANDLFGLGPMVFPNTVNIPNALVNTGPQWLQSQIRLTPNTHLKMGPNTNLFVAPNNIYGIQIPVINFNDNILSFEILDYCQSNIANAPVNEDTILMASPLFMYYNTFTTFLNNTIPSFTICTCLINPNTLLWTSYCIPGTNFTLSP